MAKQIWKSGTMLYPLPAVMVSCAHADHDNIITIAWTGIVCTQPAITYISLRPERYSYALIRDSGEFVINLVPSSLARAADYCGVVSGRDADKFAAMHLTRQPMSQLACPGISESPLQLECRVREITPLGSHHMFLADILCVQADDTLLDPSNRLRLDKSSLLTYIHGHYYSPGSQLGHFGFSIRKHRRKK